MTVDGYINMAKCSSLYCTYTYLGTQYHNTCKSIPIYQETKMSFRVKKPEPPCT